MLKIKCLSVYRVHYLTFKPLGIITLCSINSAAMKVLNLEEKFGLFDDHWSPKIIAQLNGQDVKLAKMRAPLSGILTKTKTSFSRSSEVR